ncbi:MAG: Bug family tripartite tricarboxylate transporter substrate binding protein [Burkholderiales bacterium]
MRRIATTLMFLAAIAGLHARADDYPVKPIRLIIPFAPGGITDTTARAVTDRLGARLGQQVVIESRPGAGGNIGTQMVANAAPDGYTLLLGFDGTLVINPHVYAKMPFDTLRDFAPITRLGDATLILVAHPSVTANNIAELAVLSKQKPGTLSYGSAGNGTTGHVAAELLRLSAGVDMTHVPYKGGAPALVDVVAGQIQLVSTAVASAVQFVKQGRVKAIGVSSAKRDPALPDVPTFSESGAPGYIATSWTGLLAPAKTPRAIIDRLNREIVTLLADPEVQSRYAAIGVVPGGTTPEGYAQLIRDDLAKWGKVVKDAGIKIE